MIIVSWLLGLILLAGVIARRRLTWRRICVCLLGWIMGCILGCLPGACFLVPALQANSAEPFPFYLILPTILFLVGATIGAIAGVAIMDRLVSKLPSGPGAVAAACGGLFLGLLLSLPAAAFVDEKWEQSAWGLLSLLAIAGLTVGGFALRAEVRS
jgi:hypothetical protein